MRQRSIIRISVGTQMYFKAQMCLVPWNMPGNLVSIGKPCKGILQRFFHNDVSSLFIQIVFYIEIGHLPQYFVVDAPFKWIYVILWCIFGVLRFHICNSLAYGWSFWWRCHHHPSNSQQASPFCTWNVGSRRPYYIPIFKIIMRPLVGSRERSFMLWGVPPTLQGEELPYFQPLS